MRSSPTASSPTPTDSCPGLIADLVVRCGRGDDVALGALFDVFLPSVLGVVGNGYPSEQTDALAVETFHHVWLHASSYDPRIQDAVTWVLDQARAVRGRPAPAHVPAA